MVLQIRRTKLKRANYFISDEEVALLWQAAKRRGTKFQVMLGFTLFRGMRIGEVCAVNLCDFQGENFNKLNIILEKSHIVDEFPLLAEFANLVREYIVQNRHTFKDGYLFPYHSSRKNFPYMNPKSAIDLFYKFRATVGKEQPWILDKRTWTDDAGVVHVKYRVSWHSCRRWFETRIWDKYKDKMQLRDIMRYRHSKVVDVYIDAYQVWKDEDRILNDTFSGLWAKVNNQAVGQTKLSLFDPEIKRKGRYI